MYNFISQLGATSHYASWEEVFEQVKYMAFSSMEYAFSSFGNAAQYTLKALTIGLSIQSSLAPSTTFQCQNIENNLAFFNYISSSSVSTSFDELQLYYDIYGNIENLDNAEYYIFLENHINQTHHELKTYFVNKLASQEDSIIFEGVSQNTANFCERFCLGDNGHSHYFDEDIESNYLDKYRNKNCNFRLKDSLWCSGWENPDKFQSNARIMHSHQIISRLYPKIFSQYENIHIIYSDYFKYKKESSARDFLNQVYLFYTSIESEKSHLGLSGDLSHLNKYIRSLENTINSFNRGENIKSKSLEKKFYRYYQQVEELMIGVNTYAALISDKFDEEIIIARNKEGLEKTMKSQRKDNKKFIFSGIGHFFKSVSNLNYDDINPNDPQYELRVALRKYKHVLLVPR